MSRDRPTPQPSTRPPTPAAPASASAPEWVPSAKLLRALLDAVEAVLEEGIHDVTLKTPDGRRRAEGLYRGFEDAEAALARVRRRAAMPTGDPEDIAHLVGVATSLMLWATHGGMPGTPETTALREVLNRYARAERQGLARAARPGKLAARRRAAG